MAVEFDPVCRSAKIDLLRRSLKMCSNWPLHLAVNACWLFELAQPYTLLCLQHGSVQSTAHRLATSLDDCPSYKLQVVLAFSLIG